MEEEDKEEGGKEKALLDHDPPAWFIGRTEGKMGR